MRFFFCRFGKNPNVDTHFLPDVDRDEEENQLRESLRQVNYTHFSGSLTIFLVSTLISPKILNTFMLDPLLKSWRLKTVHIFTDPYFLLLNWSNTEKTLIWGKTLTSSFTTGDP